MNLCDPIPGLDAEAMKTIRLDAIRLGISGTPKQQEQARGALGLFGDEGSRRATAVRANSPDAQPKSGSDRAPMPNGKGRSTHVAS